ncbi:uncharacterized protein LOC133716347 [Rosa rugosa]|uniref:uncharacterized protein LOC133716347 n=1 Tax=Rosa rugosa TaxID=74645 RepID=UPI002B414B89|nr:uncharacterized protein LOC133716347 [Rosa rugosa]
MEDVVKLKNIIYREENQVSESAVEVASLTTDDDCKTLSGVNDESDLEVTIRTACRGKHFRRTMSSLSDEKVAATYEIGFGSLHRFRCGKVNLPLCQMLVENFDVRNSCIKIHGRNLTITHEDFRRIMGVMDGGCDVNLEGSTEDPDILGLKSKLSRKEKEITIHGLRRLLIEFESTDDTFKVSFALYALATLLIPVTGIEVDPRYLIPLKDPNALGSKNWAKFAFAKLVEGVSSIQATRTGLAGGCILFLQLFYLDVVGNGIYIYPKIGKPVMMWSRDDLKRVYEKVESEGGFKSENVRVTKKYFRGNVLSGTGSVDPSTGIKTTVVDDLSEMRSDVGLVKGDIESLKLTVGRLRRAILTLESTVGELKANGLGGIVAKAIKQVFEDKSYTYGGNFGNDGLFINEEHQGTEAEQHDDEMPHNKSIIVSCLLCSINLQPHFWIYLDGVICFV